ncbi:unnamed protein product, partial [Durusdinium trenchii]
FFAAIRAGNDTWLRAQLEQGQSPATVWEDGERSALVYALLGEVRNNRTDFDRRR